MDVTPPKTTISTKAWNNFVSKFTEQLDLPFIANENLENFPVPPGVLLKQFIPPSILGKEIHFLIHLFQTWNSIKSDNAVPGFDDESPSMKNQIQFQEKMIKYFDFLNCVTTPG